MSHSCTSAAPSANPRLHSGINNRRGPSPSRKYSGSSVEILQMNNGGDEGGIYISFGEG